MLIASIGLSAFTLAAVGGIIAVAVTHRVSPELRRAVCNRGGGARAVLPASPWKAGAWGAVRQVTVAAIAAGSTYGIGALLGANV